MIERRAPGPDAMFDLLDLPRARETTTFRVAVYFLGE